MQKQGDLHLFPPSPTLPPPTTTEITTALHEEVFENRKKNYCVTTWTFLTITVGDTSLWFRDATCDK